MALAALAPRCIFNRYVKPTGTGVRVTACGLRGFQRARHPIRFSDDDPRCGVAQGVQKRIRLGARGRRRLLDRAVERDQSPRGAGGLFPEDTGQIVVEVHQIVRDLPGAVLADEYVGHRFTLQNGLIGKMEVCAPPSSELFIGHP